MADDELAAIRAQRMAQMRQQQQPQSGDSQVLLILYHLYQMAKLKIPYFRMLKNKKKIVDNKRLT